VKTLDQAWEIAVAARKNSYSTVFEIRGRGGPQDSAVGRAGSRLQCGERQLRRNLVRRTLCRGGAISQLARGIR